MHNQGITLRIFGDFRIKIFGTSIRNASALEFLRA